MTRVEFLRDLKGYFPNGKRKYQAGQVYDISDEQEARLWIKRGYAVVCPAPAAESGTPAEAPIERATNGPSETATVPGTGSGGGARPKPRRRRKATSANQNAG